MRLNLNDLLALDEWQIMEKQKTYPVLCGGTFFLLVLDAIKDRTGVRERTEGGSDGLSEPNVLVGLYKIINPEVPKSISSSISSFVSSYKYCKQNATPKINFNDGAVIEAFNRRVTEKYRSALKQTEEFVADFLCTSRESKKLEKLVRNLANLILLDQSIKGDDIFYIGKSGEPTKKDDFKELKRINAIPFILGVWHYIIMNRSDNKRGEKTAKSWRGLSRKVTTDLLNDVLVTYETPCCENRTLDNKQSIYSKSNDEELQKINISYFKKYLKSSCRYYSDKKTLVNPEKTFDFYDLYVCNDLSYRQGMQYRTIQNATLDYISFISEHAIIQGTGGAGKSMLITHIFLTAANQVNNGVVPILVSLKDYCEENKDFLDFVYNSIAPFDRTIKKEHLVDCLNNNNVALLCDGLDEIRTNLRSVFAQELESFIKSYGGNKIIITSRPISSFVSFRSFTVFNIEPLSKNQAIEVVKRLEFWDKNSKERFIKDLDRNLYNTHREFASNPLLLTIMLMTYSYFGEIPDKRYVFYSKAYETMSRLHDATKGGFVRPLHTNISPEIFAKFFAEFCARTFRDEKFSFDFELFSRYMDKVIENRGKIEKPNVDCTSYNFALDLTDNLCLMYKEGFQYYFMHRSFQEYFMALHFSYADDSQLRKLGSLYENREKYSSSDLSFGMLYDLIPERVEKHIFLPFLEKTVSEFNKDPRGAYWAFLKLMYPTIYVHVGEVNDENVNEPSSFLYRKIIEKKRIKCELDVGYQWPDELKSFDGMDWVYAYSDYTSSSSFAKSLEISGGYIPEEPNCDEELVMEDELPSEYIDYFGFPPVEGTSYELEIDDLYERKELVNFMNNDEFPLKKEFNHLMKYYEGLKRWIHVQDESDSLFDD